MQDDAPTLPKLAGVFVKIGILGFGGPAAHIAMMEEETVRRRGWISAQDFLDLVGATNLIPGPNSTEMAIHLGLRLKGWAGLLVSGICFITPAAMITAAIAWFYVRYGQLPEVAPFLYGIKPAVLAVIVVAVLRFARKAVKNVSLAILAIGVLVCALLGLQEVMLILAGGVLGMLWQRWRSQGTMMSLSLPLLFLSASDAVAQRPELKDISLFFLKIGCVLFGSGYVLFAFLEGELVRDSGWLTSQQLVDAVAIGQFTPGPILSTATFVGFLLQGWTGALAATVAIFLPSFIFVIALSPVVPRLRKSAWTSAFLDSVNVSAVALMTSVAFLLGDQILNDYFSILLSVLSAFLLFRYKLNSGLIIVASAGLGWVAQALSLP